MSSQFVRKQKEIAETALAMETKIKDSQYAIRAMVKPPHEGLVWGLYRVLIQGY